MSIYGPVKKKNKNRANKDAHDFINKDHSDKNMLVAIRVRPLYCPSHQEPSSKTSTRPILDIVKVEDNLLIVRDKAEIIYEQDGVKPDVLHRSKEQKFYFDRILISKQQLFFEFNHL